MQGDLISRSELIEMIEGTEELLDFQKDECIACINACDVAYDVEKVVDQIHNKYESFLDEIIDNPKEATKLDFLFRQNQIICGIVRNGGKE